MKFSGSSIALGAALAAFALILSPACRKKDTTAPPVATPSVSLNHDRAPIGSPVEITYTFAVAPDAKFDQDYRVMLHIVDTDEELMWTDDHNPPTPTSQWKPGQTVQYTRTVFVPKFPYVGEATLQLGLYSTQTQKRLALKGDDVGQHAYRVGRLQIAPETDNVYTVFTDGWHAAEVADHNAAIEWHWTKKDATLTFRNPKKDAVFYLDVDNPGSVFKETQHVTVTIGNNTVDEFSLGPNQQLLRTIKLQPAQLGTADMVELHIDVDKTFVPALLNASTNHDPRELGIRVFHAFVDAR